MTSSDAVKAYCFLEQLDDEKNKVSLTESGLTIRYRNRQEHFDLTHIKGFSFGYRKAMLYLIGGGIIVPLTSVAYYRDFLNPWPTLFLLFGGIFAMYVGWRGYPVFSINLFGYSRDYKLGEISNNLRAFVEFASTLLPVNKNLNLETERMIFHVTPLDTWKQKKSNTHYSGKSQQGFIHASTKRQIAETIKKHFKGKSELLLLTIDPLKVTPEIRYEDLESGGQLYPHIYGDLNLDAVVKVEEIN
ncbi:MAG: hypothetical protein DHS20C17_11730 [Cyclobacteriaceae bacterium]|nr:MAG: hypothetical protein DHS20C17_11730 [Cyclobacteriaceae bacterium]